MRRRDESDEQYIARLTHVRVTDHNLVDMKHAGMCKNATALFLYDNRINRITNLERCTRLTHVCLQHNNIRRLEGLHTLYNLKKLRLGHNAITVVEGLHNCYELEELHIEDQKLPPGETLVFDPRSLRGIKNSLQILNVSGNRVEEVLGLVQLRGLRQLNLSNNFVRSLRELTQLLHSNLALQRLWVDNNPICHVKKYRDTIIANSPRLVTLDERAVTDLTRQFVINLKMHLNSSKGTRAIAGSGAGSAASTSQLNVAKVPKFPSKFSAQNPHWLPPLPTKRGMQN